MAKNVKFLTGNISYDSGESAIEKLPTLESDGSTVGQVYFATDIDNNQGMILFDTQKTAESEPKRIIMADSTDAYLDSIELILDCGHAPEAPYIPPEQTGNRLYIQQVYDGTQATNKLSIE